MKVIKGIQVGPRKVLVYGRHGVGKSSWAASAPNPLFLSTEDGTGDLDVARSRVYSTLGQFRDDVLHLNTSGKLEYDSLVVDSVDWLEKLIHKDVVQNYDKTIESIAEIPYGRGYEHALDTMRGILLALSRIQNKQLEDYDHGVHIILVAHASISKYEDPVTEAYDRITPALHVNGKGKGAALEVQEWCDEVFYLAEKIYTRESDRGFNSKVVKAVSSGEMVLYTRSQAAFDAKSRLTMPDEIPFPKGAGWGEFAKYFPKQEAKTEKENDQ